MQKKKKKTHTQIGNECGEIHITVLNVTYQCKPNGKTPIPNFEQEKMLPFHNMIPDWVCSHRTDF